MRLLEPINGVKFSQGNYMQHIIFFIAMFTMDLDVNKNFRPSQLGLMSLNSSGAHASEDEPSD